MIHMRKNDITYLVGTEELQVKPDIPYSSLVCEFLNELSKKLRIDNEAKEYTDILTFAFWCRRANILKLKEDFLDKKTRIGRGLVFHIAPSNVPINFAYSFAFGLLSGNGNIVRVSTKNFLQVRIVCKVINKLFNDEKYIKLRNQNAIVLYEINKEITDYFSSICDARIIWGGDNTIREIRKSEINTRCVEINFADRYSLGIISSEEILKLDETELNRLAEKFYNDTYLMDQNACSAPHLIIWKSSYEGLTKEAQDKFWTSLYNVAQKYNLSEIKVSDKYTMLCEQAVKLEAFGSFKKYENLLYLINLSYLPKDINELRGKFGLFYQCRIDDFISLLKCINNKVQTCVYFGIERQEIVDFIIDNNLRGIDRIVPIGNSLDINTIWDGYDIIGSLSRIIG